TNQTAGDLAISASRIKTMSDQDGIGEISNGADRLSLNPTVAISVGESEKFFEPVLPTVTRKNPHGMETTIHTEVISCQNTADSTDALLAAAFVFRLGLDTLVVVLQIKPGDPTFDVPFFKRDRHRGTRLSVRTGVANSVDPAAPPPRSLPI